MFYYCYNINVNLAAPVLEFDKKIEKQTVKSGSMFIINVNVSGVPTPTVQWFFKDRPVSAVSKANVETSNSYTTLQIKGAETNEAGIYKVIAENKVGSTEAEFSINMLGKLFYHRI